MSETRAGKYGRHLGSLVEFVVDSQPPEIREQYRDEFLAELENYSFTPRKKGEPVNEGCIHELKEVEVFDVNDPVHLALLAKETLHLMYQKQTSARVYESFIRSLKTE